MQSHVVRLERILRVFQGSWREKTKQCMTITLRDIPSLVQYLLDHSYFTVGSQVFRQRRGASIWDPSLHPFYALQLHFNENGTSQCHFLHLLGIVLYIIDTLTIVFC